MIVTSSSKHPPAKRILLATTLRDRPLDRHFAALSRRLLESGYEVTLLVSGSNGEPAFDPGVRVLYWPSPRPTCVVDALFFDRLVRQLRPVCLVSNFGARAIMMTIGKLRQVPVRVHWHHTMASQVEADWRRNRLLLRCLRLRARVTLRFATHLIANSECAKLDLIHNYGQPAGKCKVFWNSAADPFSETAFMRSRVATHPAPATFVCAGRFTFSKGQDVLLRALAQVIQKHPKASAVFIGDGEDRAECEGLARQLGLERNCSFAGWLPHQEVLSQMSRARAVIVPSRSEAFGLVNIESMSVGTPVIGSKTGGVAEIVRDEIDGFLFPPGDAARLARCMIRLIEDEPLRTQMAANARDRFLGNFESARSVRVQSSWFDEQILGALPSART